ncbi:Molybdenum cofactor biosynthesis, MoeB [Penicillium expansum]|uniref:Ubiquitin-like modifier-activating enzyme ATG7 n=1 Tax=Penicillium expansum TaxID=27334 RepID=A0A0A2JAE8_PENEN|nr:Molybdenum cofactor biosynthesis, MoeB [Penicillium expansum]KGO43835.1 Molybdenum cofactor biosynthesis, MoeB [Penicillium expansum]KGO49310.1 Molybdenum cofactor biosynthesis, MoeB [Penicillium expansum]KGO52199.1 Molybdenum cofactor biosynthesis, MoeB [Penicillium expansum]
MQYTPFASDIELPFYTSLASHKINHDKLDDSARPVLGLYEIRPSDPEAASCRIQIHGNALAGSEAPAGYYRAEDLKKYKFHYWFAFPAIHSDPQWVPVRSTDQLSQPHQDLDIDNLKGTHLSSHESTALVEAVQTWSYIVDHRQRGFFLARKAKQHSDNASSSDSEIENAEPDDSSNSNWQIASLSEYENGFFKNVAAEDRYFCFSDPSNYEQAPGWMLRNLLVLIKQRWGIERVQLIRYRDVHAKRDQGRSTVIQLESGSKQEAQTPKSLQSQGSLPLPKVTGWERNSTGKLAGRIVNLTEYMDPKRLADQSVDLNLKLIKWRISPTLDLEKIKHTTCLLLGAGTLGSYVSRNLLGWGVKKITFVDNGTVSFSNPVRQPLFNFEDCLNGGVRKAHRASEALTQIYPGVETTGHALSVPMAGHPIVDEGVTRADFDRLKTLIDEHDAIFLLMDTRESRWLPTVMGKAAGKIVMNAALGFDSFVVMRHGITEDENPAELGCYFCNDVVAPANSIKDQTLDQQCTVTRPGVAPIASALLVELFVSLLQHPQGAAAPAPIARNTERDSHPLGIVPHQIRGFLSNFENLSVTGKSYPSCSACSDKVVSAYRDQGWDFVRRALNEHGYVEELSGLKEVHEKAEAALADIDWDEASDNEDIEIL